MDKVFLQPLSGFRDQLAPVKSVLIDELKRTFQQFGYQELETPVIERQEILLEKMGDEARKLHYLFEDNGERKVGLRYDLTIPLSRFIAANYQNLALPFKRFEIGPVFRAEKPQAGRFRQFSQADIDIIGSEAGERELLEITAEIVKKFDLKLTCAINNRQVVGAIFDELAIKEDLRPKLLRLLDKKDKIGAERLTKELSDLGLTGVQQKAVNGSFLGSDDPINEVKRLLNDFPPLKNLEALIKYAGSLGLKIKFDLAMVRGLDYYTGTILECFNENYAGGSVIAGGRYDNLVESLIGQKLPAVGVSFGLDRLAEVATLKMPMGRFIVCLPETESEVRRWATELRASGQTVEVYLDSTIELGKQIKYAAKRGYPSIIIPLEAAWKNGQVEVKDLETGRQEAVKRSDVANG